MALGGRKNISFWCEKARALRWEKRKEEEEKRRREKEKEIQVWKLILVSLEHLFCLELLYL